VKISKDLTTKFNARDIAKRVAKIFEGGGGGREDFAQAGGKHPEKFDEAIKLIHDLIGGEG